VRHAGLVAAAGLVLVSLAAARAEPVAAPPPAPVEAQGQAAKDPPGKDPAIIAKETERATRQMELEETQRVLQASDAEKARLQAEVDELRADRARLNAALIDAGAKVKAAENRIDGIEQRLTTLGQTSDAIRTSLDRRRGVVVEVLAALQRMGRSPPPAVLVKPEDMLEAVRASMMLGAVLPELRSETEALASDLAEMLRLRDATAAERDGLKSEVAALAEDRQRLALLVEARQRDVAAA
jgi:murein hydrolase activator